MKNAEQTGGAAVNGLAMTAFLLYASSHGREECVMNRSVRRILFALFFVSGFSGLVYQVVWTRIAFASFGIILPVLSVVLSVFMLGLSVGAWGAGRFVPLWTRKTGLSAAVLYALTELLIGGGAFAVPRLFRVGEQLLLAAGQTDSAAYLSLSAIVLAASILPWCLFMGATFPLMLAYVREREPGNTESFSFLYLANVAGAMCGTMLTALVLVELLGFKQTLAVAAAGNGGVALVSGFLGWRQSRIGVRPVATGDDQPVAPPGSAWPAALQPRMARWILFSTGFCAMAMEVVWARAFTPVLRTQVYSFAAIVVCYLGATCAGSWLYRRDLRRGTVHSVASVLSFLAAAALLPVLVDDFRVLPKEWRGPMDPISAMMLLSSIGPLCAALGYLTPGLIDNFASGHPREAGKAYAVNVLGCILGPLCACYVLLPLISERHALILLSLPFFAFWLLHFRSLAAPQRWGWGFACGAVLACALFVTQDFFGRVSRIARRLEVRRDYAAFVVSVGEGRDSLLMVNGMDMTVLSPVTKYMVHLPLLLQKEKPESALIICFGMGTTHRSALSWDIQTTTVELIPSVREAFGFYHSDATQLVHNPKGQIVIDDGRRFLRRTPEKYDAIVIDPPPPVMAAGSSLLYSVEFYELAKQHLKPNGILQAWVPEHNIALAPAVLRSVCDSFPYARGFRALEKGGYHVLGSMQPIEVPTAAALVERMPEAARKDLLEWSSSQNVTADLNSVLTNELYLTAELDPDPRVRITDDRPYNEYYLFRKFVRKTELRANTRQNVRAANSGSLAAAAK